MHPIVHPAIDCVQQLITTAAISCGYDAAMDLRQLEHFVAVAEELSFTRAASRLHVVQPTVSATIASLERGLHAQLLHRTSRQVDLTDAGHALLPRARAALESVRQARDAVEAVNGGVSGTLRLGTMTALPSVDLPALLGAYRRAYPSVAAHLATPSSSEGSLGLVKALLDGRLDAAFVSIVGEPPAGVDLNCLVLTRLELIILKDDPLAGRDRVSMSDLADRAFIDSPDGCGIRAVTERAFHQAGVFRDVVVETTVISDGADYVREGLGIALLPRTVVEPYEELLSVPVSDAELDLPVSIATPTGRVPNAATRAFVRLLAATS